MSTKCIIKIINKETGKEVLLYHYYDGYVAKNSGVAFDICDAFYNKEAKNLDLPTNFSFLVNTFLQGGVGDGDLGYKYCENIPTDIEFMYTIVCRGTTTDIIAQEVDYISDGFKISNTWYQPDLVKLYRSSVVEPITNEQVRAIHACYKKDLNWCDQRYKNLIMVMFGVTTCKDLNTEQADMLINTLNSLKEV